MGYESLLWTVLAAVPGFVAVVWNWFRQRADRTPAKWDDRFVKGVEDVARKVVHQNKVEK